MIRRTEQLLLDNQALFAQDVRFQEISPSFQSRSAAMEQMLDQWQRLNIPLGAVKSEKQERLYESFILLADLLKTCLLENNDVENLTHLQKNREKLLLAPTSKKVELAEVLQHIAEDYRTELEKYSKGKDLLTNTAKLLQEYKGVGQRPSVNRTENAIRRAYLYDEIKDLAQFIQGTMRVFIQTYRTEAPEFHDRFMAYSKIGSSKVNSDSLSYDEGDNINPSTGTSGIEEVSPMVKANGITIAEPTGPSIPNQSDKNNVEHITDAKAEKLKKSRKQRKNGNARARKNSNRITQT